MSIWCSGSHIGWSDWTEPDEPQPVGGDVRAYANGWSNHYPSVDVEAPASVDLAHIAPWCTPGHDQDGEGYRCSNCADQHDHPECGGWVRLSMDAPEALTWWTKDGKNPTPEPVHASVVMDEPAARELARQLLEWADLPHLTPIEAKP